MTLLTAELGAVQAAGAGAIEDTWSVCPRHIRQAEQQHALPAHLLTAISKVESGRWNAAAKANLAWPWTVMAEGKGRYLPSKTAAIAEVRALRARGIRNIDVGCMQINLHYHPKAFENLEEAFNPQHNTAYAASLLSKLRSAAGSWTRAIGDYHSKTISFARVYRLKVFKAWRAERHADNRRQREARLAQHRKHKALQLKIAQQKAAAPSPRRQSTSDDTAENNPSAGIWQ
ncbi:transglycosylase SLT domain-containing protein [Pelagibius sp. Alg239-R121]|uniref:transglycosylase SLT domain-containing protein n=1 Tax=Pelagibius sp. Alg239-R121 TaxID=2993448 RepID=UPI0024A63380|nr:transglycosylase SLT domain-containing protein [Pelagibius sp. Alg239-R121]